jgi:hypothetical protein
MTPTIGNTATTAPTPASADSDVLARGRQMLAQARHARAVALADVALQRASPHDIICQAATPAGHPLLRLSLHQLL